MRINNGEIQEHKGGVLDHGWVRLWLLYAGWASLSGWLLSFLENLTAFSYGVSFFLFSVLILKFWGRLGFGPKSFTLFSIRSGRWRRPLPLVFLVLLGVIAIGGMLYPPNNHDFLAYRFSRMLHWWAEEGWHWINTVNSRMNYSGTGFEWMALPLFAFSGSDRPFFLINFSAYALLPGLLYSVFRDLGLSRRLAWHWMWILPCAYCYVMQAGSAGNDAFGAVFLLASVHFFRRAVTLGRTADFWWGMMAAALLTGIKLSNLPLLLPCLIAAWPACGAALRKPWALLFFLGLGVMLSALPGTVANAFYSGHWSGDPLNLDRLQISNPVAGLLGNGIQLAGQSLVPPFVPGEGRFSRWIMEFLPSGWIDLFSRDFPRFYLGVTELPQEESVGLGLGICFLLLSSLAAVFFGPRTSAPGNRLWSQFGKWTCLGAWGALLFFMVKMGSECTARLLCSYYPLLIVSLLALPGWDWLTRKKWWQVLAVLTMGSALIPLLMTPSRPLGPAQGILAWMGGHLMEPKQLARVNQVYEVYERREDVLRPLREVLPVDARVIGFLGGGDDIEISFWRPFNERFVISPKTADRFPEWVILNEDGARLRGYGSVDLWAAHFGYKVVDQMAITTKIRQGDVLWTVARKESEAPWRNPFEFPRIPGGVAWLILGLAWGCSRLYGEKLLMKGGSGENLVALGIFQAWLFWTAGMVLAGWILSAYQALFWLGPLSLGVGAFLILQIRLQWVRAPQADRREVIDWMRYRPWLGVSGLIVLASLFYPPLTLDSLSYRIPRILFWMQEGGLTYVPACDPRLNYMTPNWEWSAMPFFLLGWDRLLRVPSMISWVLLYLLFCSFAKQLNPASKNIRICAFLCAGSTMAILQAASSVNDLFAAVLMVLSVFFMVQYERAPKAENVWMSGVFLALAAGTKPHFAVMALPWMLWFVFSRGRPWGVVWSWKLLWIVPVALICSPLPTFLLNKLYFGSWKGEPDDTFVSGGHWLANLLFGSVMMLWQMLQPPLHPLYTLQNSVVGAWVELSGVRTWVPHFLLEAKPAAIVDRASLGLVSSLVLGVGLWKFFQTGKVRSQWPFLVGLAGLIGFLMAISQVVPWTVGRSFCGFALLLFPAALAGLLRLSAGTLRGWTIAVALSCSISLIFSSSHPLWPVEMLGDYVGRNHPDSALARTLKLSMEFSSRSETGKELVAMIPASEKNLLALVAVDRPMTALWQPYSYNRRVTTFNKNVTPEEIVAQPGRFLLTSAGVDDYYPGLMAGLAKLGVFREVAARDYISSLGRGAETWRLWERIDFPEPEKSKKP